MNFDQWTKVLQEVISLLQVIIWPLMLFLLLFLFRASLRKILENMSELSVKAAGVEASVKTQIEVAASLGAAQGAWNAVGTNTNGKPPMAGDPQTIAKLVGQVVTPQTSRQLRGTHILWVDDIPENNTYQRNALEALGIRFTLSLNTDDAIQKLKATLFDAIISDMGRPPDSHAGYTLLEKVKQMGISTPYIIYAHGGNLPENRSEALRRGAYASTSGPQMLFETVIDAIKSDHR